MAGIRAYNSFLRALKGAKGISHKEAQQAYRGMTARLGRAPKAKDITAHPRITREEAKRAAADIKKEERRKAREVRKAIERAKEPRKPREKKPAAPRKGKAKEQPPPPRETAAPPVDRGGAAGATVSRRAAREFEEDYGGFEDEIWYDFEDPLEDTGEGAE